MIPLKPFYFIRHGETDWNRQNICMGSTDIPLNPLGIEQAEIAAQILKSELIVHIVTSPLSRAKQTADIIAEVLQKPLTVIDDLKEYCSGVAEGEQNESRERLLERWHTGEVQEGAETVRDFESRVAGALTQALKLPEPVLIVSHGVVYAAITKILGLPQVTISNCAMFYHTPSTQEGNQWEVTALRNL